jgi:galactose-6-phosphate isomerase
MPNIDVTELLSDPDFATAFDVIRTAQAVGSTGRATGTPATTSGVIGVIVPLSTTELDRFPEGERLHGRVRVITTFRLSSGDAPSTADIVVWKGRQWTVVQVNDYSEFGAGFMDATCEMRPLNP